MAGGKLWGAWLALVALAAAYASPLFLIGSATSADAQPRMPVAVGEVGVAQGHGDRGRVQFQHALARELDSVGSLRVTNRGQARYVVRGSVVRLERRPLRRGYEVQCEVSLIVTDARGESVRMMLQGRAGARGEGAVERVEQLALQAAVRSAVRPLPSSLETSEASQRAQAPRRRTAPVRRGGRRT